MFHAAIKAASSLFMVLLTVTAVLPKSLSATNTLAAKLPFASFFAWRPTRLPGSPDPFQEFLNSQPQPFGGLQGGTSGAGGRTPALNNPASRITFHDPIVTYHFTHLLK